MHLYGLTIQRSAAINCAVYGNFSKAKVDEVIVSHGKTLELYRVDESGKIHSVVCTDVFGLIRDIKPFRLTGSTRDYLAIASDSGRIVIVEFSAEKNMFVKVHQETFGKSGCRRLVPGQYLAADPKGRAVLIGAVEKNKLVYILNRDTSANLTISSPLEAHKSHTVVFSCCGLDVGYDNPLFACLELDYEQADQAGFVPDEEVSYKSLTYYELDLGLNHVVRKWTDSVDMTANLLIAVPGGDDGPGGVLVCSESWLSFKHSTASPDMDVRTPFPRREGMDIDDGLLVVAYATHKQKGMFFFLLQSELGDLYKVSLVYEQDEVTDIVIQYFDTVPVASSLAILKGGYLFVASEFGDHKLYVFNSLGPDEEAALTHAGTSSFVRTANDDLDLLSFSPTEAVQGEAGDIEHSYLAECDSINSMSPLMDAKVMDIASENSSQMYTLCGRGASSSMRILRHGLAVTQMAKSPLPGNPTAVWTVRLRAADPHDTYICVSFANATLMLSIGDTVEEVTDSGFLDTSGTLCVGTLANDSLVQVHPNGIRHVHANKRVNEWTTPGRKEIKHASVNQRQVIVALTGGDLLYFELEDGGQLEEVERKDLQQDIASLHIPQVPEGRRRASFVAIGGIDNAVRVMSLEPATRFQVMALQALPAQATSLHMIEVSDSPSAGDGLAGGAGGSSGGAGGPESSTLYLNMGLSNGVLLRAVVDHLTGQLSDTRSRFLGSKAIKLFSVKVQGVRAVAALSSRTWLGYQFQGKSLTTPLSYDTLEHVSPFSSEQCPEGMVAVAGNELHIISLDTLGETFNQVKLPFRYTPRRFVVHPATNHVVVVESDHRTYSVAERKRIAKEAAAEAAADEEGEGGGGGGEAAKMDEGAGEKAAKEGEAAAEEEELAEVNPQIGSLKAPLKTWASCIRVMDASESTTLGVPLEMEPGVAALNICTCVFTGRQEVYVIVAAAKNIVLGPKQGAEKGLLLTYTLAAGGQLDLVHSTELDDVPRALCPFQGKLLVGAGKSVRIYDLGKKKLLRKCENRSMPTMVVGIQVKGDRIFIADVQESIHLAKYKRAENQIYVFADDTVPRWTTCMAVLDADTVAGADKFGNVFVIRLPSEISHEIEDDPTGSRIKWDSGLLNGAAHKMGTLVNYHVGEMVTSIHKTSLMPGGSEALIYTTLMGGIGALVPFGSREDVDFFTHLEMHMRQERPPLAGRDHLAFRSAYFPAKDVVDGDLCEQFSMLSVDRQKDVSDELDRSPNEVMKKLEDVRNRII